MQKLFPASILGIGSQFGLILYNLRMNKFYIVKILIATLPGLIASGPVIVYMNVDRRKRKWAWRCCCFSGPTSTTTTSARPSCVKVASVYDDANEVRPILALLHVKYCVLYKCKHWGALHFTGIGLFHM